MPPLLGLFLVLTVMEKIWFAPPRGPRERPVDTALAAVAGPAPTGDAVVIEPEPDPLAVDPAGLSAAPSALAKVRDDTFFRDADLDAWLQTWLTLKDLGQSGLAKAAAERVSFGELFGQPKSFRGRLVRVRGTMHRVEELKAPDNNYAVDRYWQGWLEPAGGPASPIVVQFLELPPGMPTGLKIHEPVDVVGYFFKRYAYNAADTIRVAPLVMALQPAWKPLPRLTPGGTSLGTWAIVTMTALVVATLAGMRLAAGGGARQRAEPVDLDASLAGHMPFSHEEALRRLAESTDTREEPLHDSEP